MTSEELEFIMKEPNVDASGQAADPTPLLQALGGIDRSSGNPYLAPARWPVMPLFARIAAVVLLSFTLSLHWALLQGVAWTSMLVERVQTQSLASAIRTTFDGQHPCKICLAVKQGKAASHTDSSSVPAGVKLEPWVEFDTEPMVSEADRAPASFPGVPAGHSRHERPPLPPPRSA